MSIFIDVCLLAVFVVFVVMFSKYGFARTVYKIGKTWLSLFCSIILGPFVSERLREWFLQDLIAKGVNNTLTDLVANNPNGYTLSELFQNLPDGFVSFLNNFDISLPLLEVEYGSATEATNEIIFAISEIIAGGCAKLVSDFVGHVVCFVVALIFFAWLNFEIRKRRIGFFRVIDQIIGFVAGLVIGYCAVFGLSVLLHTIFQVVVAFNAQSSVTTIYENSYIFKFVAEFNMLGAVKQLF